MSDIYNKIINSPIKKRWFRNWYVVELGRDYYAKYTACDYLMAQLCQTSSAVFGPYWSEKEAEAAAREADDAH